MCRFQMEPIAAASLGQVHLARVNGRRVVVKVQRPFLREIFDVDLKNIRVLAQIFQALDPKSDGAARDLVAIYDECSRILYQVRMKAVAEASDIAQTPLVVIEQAHDESESANCGMG